MSKPTSLSALLLLLTVNLSQQVDYCGDVNADSLQFVLFVFRHGDRTPYETYPTDPYQVDHWMKWGGWGQLTQVGMEQHYLFGQWVRTCYSTFLNETYSPKDLYIRSTDYDRTLESAEAHLAGAYPPYGFQQWTDGEIGKQWQPIPIHTVPQTDDYLLKTDINCPPYQALIDDVWANSELIRKIQTENQQLLNDIALAANLSYPGDLDEITTTMCDAVHVERLKNLTLPEWLNDTIIEKLERWQDIWIDVELADDTMIQYAAGELMHHMQKVLKKKSKNKMTEKHYIYSAHDSTVATLLAAYGDFNRMGPPYRSAVITELHLDKATNNYFVKAFFRNDTEADPIPLQIRDCVKPTCWLEDYTRALQPVTLSDKKNTCESPQPKTGLDQGATTAIAVTASLVGTLLIVTVIFLLLPIFRRKTVVQAEDEAIIE